MATRIPLEQVNKRKFGHSSRGASSVKGDNVVGLWQCMVDGDPDIDAIHRLIFKKPPTFVHNEPLLLGKKTYVLLIRKIRYGDAKAYFRYFIYRLTVSFRFTDILRSYAAQLILDRTEIYLGFYASTSYQERERS